MIRRGFTLVELLVVIGIIALVLSILLPATASVREHARSAKCKAQLQQIGQAFRMYLNDSRDRYPRSPALPSVNPHNLPTVVEALAPHIGRNTEIFRCPSDERIFPTEKISYMYNAELGERPLRETLFFRVMQAMERVPVLWDADNFHGGKLPFNWLMTDGHVDQFIQQVKQP